MTKNFLTIGEVSSRGLPYYKYADGAYDYKINGGYTLVQDGEVLISGVSFVHLYTKNTYAYEETSGKWTFIQDGNILVSGADYVDWHEKDTYSYQMGGERVDVVNGKREKIDE